MTLALITKSQQMTVIRSALLTMLPSGVEVVSGLDNRVPEPISTDFCILTPLSSQRLELNSTDFIDVYFSGAISDKTLTVSNVYYGTIAIGQRLFGANIPTGTYIVSGTGPYTISKSLTITEQPLASGYRVDTIPTANTFQCDVHGPNSFDNASIISGMFRSDWACERFDESGLPIAPLYCSEPRQAAFRNGEQQIEERWTIDLTIQCNNRIISPQDYFDEANVTGIVAVDVFY